MFAWINGDGHVESYSLSRTMVTTQYERSILEEDAKKYGINQSFNRLLNQLMNQSNSDAKFISAKSWEYILYNINRSYWDKCSVYLIYHHWIHILLLKNYITNVILNTHTLSNPPFSFRFFSLCTSLSHCYNNKVLFVKPSKCYMLSKRIYKYWNNEIKENEQKVKNNTSIL